MTRFSVLFFPLNSFLILNILPNNFKEEELRDSDQLPSDILLYVFPVKNISNMSSRFTDSLFHQVVASGRSLLIVVINYFILLLFVVPELISKSASPTNPFAYFHISL